MTERQNRTLVIPLTNAPWAMIQVPYPMSAENWDELMAWLALCHRALTEYKAKEDEHDNRD